MTTMNRHQVADQNSNAHQRTSANRVYSHAAVSHYRAIPPSERWPHWVAAHSKAEWASRADLAHKSLSRVSRSEPGFTTDFAEVAPTVEITRQEYRALLEAAKQVAS
jgi:hypothetical protein